jgi:hypothetical protein
MRKLAIAFALLLVTPVTHEAAAKKKSINTGDPLPKKPVVSKQCHDKGAVRLIGSEPSTPFATIKKGKLESAGEACCAQWARRGAKYKTLDPYGQTVGDAEIDGGEGYDVTQCYELSFSVKKGKPGVGLYIDPDFVAPKSAVWLPSDVEKSSLMKVVASLEHAMVPSASYPCDATAKALPFGERVLYFHADGARWAVAGGPLLTIARMQDDGRWIVVDTQGSTNTCMQRAYQPRAVFDINGDGRPEIFFHSDFGDCFGDVAFGLDGLPGVAKWVEVAAAVHGSTA